MQFYKLISRNAATEAIWVFEILYGRGTNAPPYRHGRPEIVAVLCGEVSMTFDGVRHRFTKGDVVFVKGGLEHRDVTVTRPARIFRCTVDDALFARAELAEPVTVIRSELLEGALSRLISEGRLNDGGMPLALEAAVMGVLAAARRQLFTAPAAGSSREQKIEEAIRLVRDTSSSLADVAARCGYYDQAHLTRTFRQHLGVTPAEYRRRHTFGVSRTKRAVPS